MKKLPLYVAGVIALCVQFSSSGYGQDVGVRARVDSTRFVVGDPITVRIEVSHPRGLTFRLLVGDTLGAFFVLDKSNFQPQSDTVTATSIVVAKYDSGTAIVPPIEFLYTVPGDTSLHTVASNPLILTIVTVPVDTSKDIRDIKPPLSIPLTFAEVAMYVGILLAIVAIAYFVYRYWKKKQMEKATDAYVPPPKAAHVIALEELAVLKEKKLWQQGLIKAYYSELTEIIRRYFENRYNVRALEETTDEILHELRKHSHAAPILEESNTLLTLADLVKFATYQPGIPDHEEMMTIAYKIIDKTRVVEAKAVTKPERMVAIHVDQ
ncbi:MAG: hypothetical protein HY708_01865 [Ignavibacteriae bacterium]|nr:hypothetical protein [Ignavibacteriota bacterium]